MPSKISPGSAPSHSANDNGPLTSGQVKVLKMVIVVTSILIVAALLAIVGRVIYLSTFKKSTSSPIAVLPVKLAPKHTLALPTGAIVKNMSLQRNRLLVHYVTTKGPGAAILDLATGKKLSQITITNHAPIRQ